MKRSKEILNKQNKSIYNVSPWHKKMWRATGLCCKMSTKKLLDHVDSCYMLLGLQSVDSPTNQKPSHLLFFGRIRNAAVPAFFGVTWFRGHGKSQISYAKYLEPLIFTVGHLKGGNRWSGLSGWGDQTLQNPHFFRLWNDSIYSAYKLSPSYLNVLMTFFGHVSTPAPMDHWPILQRTLRNHVAVESVAAWTNEVVDAEPMERDQTVGRPHFLANFRWLSPSEKTGKIEKMNRPLK